MEILNELLSVVLSQDSINWIVGLLSVYVFSKLGPVGKLLEAIARWLLARAALQAQQSLSAKATEAVEAAEQLKSSGRITTGSEAKAHAVNTLYRQGLAGAEVEAAIESAVLHTNVIKYEKVRAAQQLSDEIQQALDGVEKRL
jgi:hypothetical protein